MVQFGKAFREKYFSLLDSDVISANHGSYGLVPDPVMEEYIKQVKKQYAFIDDFMLNEQFQQYKEAAKLIASQYYFCDYHNVAFVENATSGVNAVLRSLKFKAGDKIVMANTTYGSCYNTVKFLQKRIGVIPIVVNLEYPLEDEQILDLFEAQLPGAKLALFDAVTSMPGVRVPFIELTKLCQKYNVLSLIDGAHSIGLIKINLGQLKPDFYVSNLHKWLYVPVGCAALYVNPKHHAEIQTMPISHSYVDDDVPAQPDTLLQKFHFVGTNNFASIAVIATAINFRNQICGGEDAIANYCTNLNRQVVKYIIKTWPFAQLIENKSNTLTTPSMVSFYVPCDKFVEFYNIPCTIDWLNQDQTGKLHDKVDYYLMKKFRCRAPFYFENGKIMIRFSCQTYNELSDYEYVVNKFVESFRIYFNQSDQFKL